MLRTERMGASMRKTWTHRIGILVAITIGLAGCAPATDTPPPTTKPTPTSSSSASPTSTASATPSRSAVPKVLSCENILTPHALAELTTAPWTYIEDFPDRMRGNDLEAFVDYGGVLCMWGPPNSDMVVVLAYSPITEMQAAQQRKRLGDTGWESKVQADGSELWTQNHHSTDDVGVNAYVFRPGNWRFAYDVGDLAGLAV
jgi:hypothetical protein